MSIQSPFVCWCVWMEFENILPSVMLEYIDILREFYKFNFGCYGHDMVSCSKQAHVSDIRLS